MTQPRQFDLLVVGGGINGAGIARDAAMRGLRVCLLDADDWGGGTSSRSSMLAHGGLRYLEQFELGLVHEALQDRELMFRQAPHLVRPLRFYYPLYPHIASRRTVRVGLWLYDLLSRGKSVPKRGHLKADAVRAVLPGIEAADLKGAATFWDGQFQSVERFVMELVLDAQRHGADCRNHTPVRRLLVQDGRCTGAEREYGSRVEARATINAAGPWVDPLNERSLPAAPRLIRGTKGSHIVVPRFVDEALIVRAKDGRTFFVLPWRDHTVIGTTDTDFEGDPRDAVATAEDVAYLQESARAYFPDAPLDEIRWTYAGVRPLVHQEGLTESHVTRRHRLHDHAGDGAAGLWSIQGGKLTTYRHLAEEATTTVCRHLGHAGAKERPTRRATLPGGPLVPWARFREGAVAAATQRGLLPASAQHLVDTYGARWQQILDVADADGAKRIVKGRPHVWAEVDAAVRLEQARTLSDVLLRRTDMGFGEGPAGLVARRMQALLEWSDEERDAQVAAFRADARRFDAPKAKD